MRETRIAVLRSYLIKFMQAIIELIFILPLLLIASLSLFPENKLIIVFLGFPMCYLAGIFLCRILKTRHKTVYCFSYMMLGAVASLLIFGLNPPGLVYYWVIASILVRRGVHIANTSWIKQSPVALFGFHLAVYFALYFVFLIAEDFRPYLYIIKAGAIASVFLFLIISSFDQLKLAILSDGPKKYIPNSLLKSNITISLILFIFILVISQIRQFWNALWMVLKPVLGAVTSILAYLTSITLGKSKPVTPVSPKKSFWDKPLGPPNIIIKIIVDILGVVVAVIIAAIIINLIVRFVSMLSKWFSEKLNISRNKDTALGYTDEKENLLKSSTHRFGFKKQLFVRNIKESGWRDMKSNSEKVRYIYKQTVIKFIKKGYRFRHSLTPVEVGRELDGLYNKGNSDITAIAVLYNKAKYGSESISDQEVESLLGSTGINLKKIGN